jgi:hypothetical protein
MWSKKGMDLLIRAKLGVLFLWVGIFRASYNYSINRAVEIGPLMKNANAAMLR